MSAAQLLQDCRGMGIDIFLVDGNLKVRGNDELVRQIAPVLRERKAEVVQLLSVEASRTSEEWISMIRELDALIGEYCRRFGLSDEDMQDIMQSRKKQPLTTIPDCLAWFRQELEKDMT